MNLIVNADLEWGIGRQDRLLVRLSEDMKRFKALTIGKVVVLGRKTLQTFPGGEPLPNRTNVVMTSQANFSAGEAVICHSLKELARILDGWPDDAVFIIGGASLYRQLLPFCRLAYVTRVHQVFAADRFFPDLDRLLGWHLLEKSPVQSSVSKIGCPNTLFSYQFCLYRQEEPADIKLLLSQNDGPHHDQD